MKQLFLVLFLLSLGCKEKRYHDQEQNNVPKHVSGAMEDIIQFQKKMNMEFKDPETSPLPDRYRKDFTTLDFFEPDTSYRVMAKFTRTPV